MAKTQKELSAMHYTSRKNNGKCPRCGVELDRVGHYCSACLKKVNEYHKENREFYRENGICPYCGKEKLIGDEKQCISCRQKAYERKLRIKLPEEKKEEYYNKFKTYMKNQYAERSNSDICTRCGKRKAYHGRKKCKICLDYDAEIHRKIRYNSQVCE